MYIKVVYMYYYISYIVYLLSNTYILLKCTLKSMYETCKEMFGRCEVKCPDLDDTPAFVLPRTVTRALPSLRFTHKPLWKKVLDP